LLLLLVGAAAVAAVAAATFADWLVCHWYYYDYCIVIGLLLPLHSIFLSWQLGIAEDTGVCKSRASISVTPPIVYGAHWKKYTYPSLIPFYFKLY